jgi:hypothetical protein
MPGVRFRLLDRLSADPQHLALFTFSSNSSDMVGTQGGVTFDPELEVDFRTEEKRNYSALTFHSRTRRRFYQHPP